MSFTRTLLALGAIISMSAVNGHMMINTPAPYGKATLNNSPLVEDGSDFPCKQRPGVYAAPDSKNVMPIGADQTLSFIGSAVHGGGSCQISLTKDMQPTKSSQWMVIHSIEGGCPANTAGNLPDNPNGSSASTFKYSIPAGVAPGDYTLAWTWFNKIGNREMYMNCAPITVTGGSQKRDNYFDAVNSGNLTTRATSFPDMFIANIPTTQCTTVDSQDVQFPDPGTSVQKAGSGPLVPPTGPSCGKAVAGAGSSSGSSASGASPSGSSSGTATPPTVSGGSGSGSGTATPPTVSGGSGSSGSGSGAPAPAASAPAAPAVASPAAGSAPSAVPAGGANSSSGSGSGAGAGSGSSCTTPGQEVCSPDGTQIGMCDTTSHVVFMPVAAGTKCVGGQMVMAGGARKRNARFIDGSIRRGEALGQW